MRRNIVDTDGVYLLIKHPDEASKLFTVDWTDRLEGRTITGASASAPTGITLNGTTFDADSVQLELSGGTNGNSYDITISVTTDSLETLKVVVRVKCTTTPYYTF